MKENKIHVAYGFHVNCYHSYRGDTNDNLGFGSDIRIIRKILDTLNSMKTAELLLPMHVRCSIQWHTVLCGLKRTRPYV